MRRFEYMYASIKAEGDPLFHADLIFELNKLGKQGWEMVDVIQTKEIKIPQYPPSNAFSTEVSFIIKTYYSVILKREIHE